MQLWVRYKLGGKVFNKKVFVASANLDLGAGQMPEIMVVIMTKTRINRASIVFDKLYM